MRILEAAPELAVAVAVPHVRQAGDSNEHVSLVLDDLSKIKQEVDRIRNVLQKVIDDDQVGLGAELDEPLHVSFDESDTSAPAVLEILPVEVASDDCDPSPLKTVEVPPRARTDLGHDRC